MKEFTEEQLSAWELQLQQFLDDELDAAGLAALQQSAERDPSLAQELAAAVQLREMLRAMPQRRAPRRLQRRLLAIASSGPLRLTLPAWAWRATALACVPLFFIALNLSGPAEPSTREIARAQQELAVALTYLDRAGRKANIEFGRTLSDAMLEPLSRNTLRNISLEINLKKEYML